MKPQLFARQSDLLASVYCQLNSIDLANKLTLSLGLTIMCRV